MRRTIQCPQCGVVLNLPEDAEGKRLKCPKCANKFAANEADAKNSSAVRSHDASHDAVIGLNQSRIEKALNPGRVEPAPDQSRSGLEGDPTLPTAAGNLRETFDLLLMTQAAGPAQPATAQVGDALALFKEKRPTSRRPSAVEARAHARRCPSCGGVVPAGMSLCPTCGLDLETGVRVDLTDELAPEAPVRPAGLPLGMSILGMICALGGLVLFVASMVQWYRGRGGAEFLGLVWLFGIFASVQFLRVRSIKLLMVALTLGVMINIVTLVALPLFQAREFDQATAESRQVDDPDVEVAIPTYVERLAASGGTQRVELGIAFLIVYAGVSVYLTSPSVRRYFRS
jgi:DNA-directed RNA polymerase subunit M/transcription elongation factor TFIIS